MRAATVVLFASLVLLHRAVARHHLARGAHCVLFRLTFGCVNSSWLGSQFMTDIHSLTTIVLLHSLHSPHLQTLTFYDFTAFHAHTAFSPLYRPHHSAIRACLHPSSLPFTCYTHAWVLPACIASFLPACLPASPLRLHVGRWRTRVADKGYRMDTAIYHSSLARLPPPAAPRLSPASSYHRACCAYAAHSTYSPSLRALYGSAYTTVTLHTTPCRALCCDFLPHFCSVRFYRLRYRTLKLCVGLGLVDHTLAGLTCWVYVLAAACITSMPLCRFYLNIPSY